jgi:protein-tyrosine kinase
MSAEPDSSAPRDPGNELRLVEAVTRRQPLLWHSDQLTPSAELIFAHDPHHPRSEAIRALRTRLLLARYDARHTGSIALLSPCPAEGRSQLCAELAIAFAQLGRPTLLVDADLRHPQQHVLFGGFNLTGLAQTLRHGEPPHVNRVQGVPDMALLTSGGIPPDPLELLSGDRFEQLVLDWQRDYDFVLIDTPPVTRYSDGLVVAAVVGRALIVTRAPATSFKDLKEMTRHLAAAPIHVVGAVLNRF